MSHSTETSSSKQRTVIHLEFSSYVGSCVIIIGGVSRHIGQVSVNEMSIHWPSIGLISLIGVLV